MLCEKCSQPVHRTKKQNDSLHLYLDQLARALNEAGYDMRQVIRQEVEIPWTGYNVKEYLWKPLQMAQLGKRSTTQLTTSEIDKVYLVLDKVISERTGVTIPFPSEEEVRMSQLCKQDSV